MLEMIHPNVTCKIDKIDRRTSALNVYIGFKVPTDHIFSQCHLYYKSDGVFREVIVTPEFDWCLIGRATQEGFFLQQFSEMIRKVVPKLISDCPRSFLEIRNLTLPSHPFFNFLPSGVFKFIAKMRQTTALNFNVHLCNPTEHIFPQFSLKVSISLKLQLILLYKTSDGSFREVIKSPEFDYCLLESTHFDGFLLEQLTELFRKVIAKGTYKCPLSVISFWNITLPAHKLFSYLPSGLFKIIVPIRYDDKGPNSFNIKSRLFFKKEGNYREVISPPEIDLCLLGLSQGDNFLTQQITDMLKKVIVSLSTICPRNSFNVTNLAFPPHKLYSILPSGSYKIVLHVKFRETSLTMFTLIGVFQFESLKDKLGN
ncbi:unnamed protein product [Chironomus riparius]|uniref:Uncharacterized protein n=1 Tax=Chironomus riparius TaxID=315576 RepID=A0A9N9WUT5_9DIPT|nr:unnamed protein product [Chironomus riparius]